MKGKVLKGRYEILELIDSGGMGLVYKGIDKEIQKQVAIKILKPEYTQNEEFIQRFKKEASAASSLKHKNIVQILDSGEDGTTHYIVQEFIEGQTLKGIIQQKRAIEYGKAIRMMIDICAAMEHAHEKGLIHRDIKPQNILVDLDGNIKVTDFGIAKDVTSSTLTSMDSGVMGSVHYFSPEQAKGETVDERSDIYSLGIVFYEMVTGLLPFDGDTSIAIAIKHISDTIKPPREVNEKLPKSVNNMILKATSKDKALRYQSAREFKNDLTRALVKPAANFVRFKMDAQSKRLKKDKNRPKRNIIFLMLMTFLVLAILGTVVLMASTIFFEKNKDVLHVPKLVGLTEVDALNESTKIGLKIEKQYEYSDKVKETYVISQKPKAGEIVSKDALVTIVISQGNIPFEAPSLIDKTLEAAKETLNDAGLILGDITYEESDKPKGYIISQIPEPGGMIAAGESISVVVSGTGEETKVSVPLLKGKSVDNAAKELLNAKITRFIIYQEERKEEEGFVYEQQPVEGTQQLSGDPVSVWISGYNKKPYHALYTVTAKITGDKTLLRVVVEEDIEGVKAQFVCYENQYNNGEEVKVPLDLKMRKKGVFSVAVYAGNTTIVKQELSFE